MSSEANDGRGGRMSDDKFGEKPKSIGANMTPELRALARRNRKEFDAYRASMELWYVQGCGPNLGSSDDVYFGPSVLESNYQDQNV